MDFSYLVTTALLPQITMVTLGTAVMVGVFHRFLSQNS